MEFSEILHAAVGTEKAEEIAAKMAEEGLFLTKRENLELRYDKLKSQKEQLAMERRTLAEQLAAERAEAAEALAERNRKLEQLTGNLHERIFDEAVTKAGAKNPALVKAILMASPFETMQDGSLPELTPRLLKLQQEEPYLFHEGYAPEAGEQQPDPENLTDAEYFALHNRKDQ